MNCRNYHFAVPRINLRKDVGVARIRGRLLYDACILTHRTYKYVTLYGKGELRVQMKFKFIKVHHKIKRVLWIIHWAEYDHRNSSNCKREAEEESQEIWRFYSGSFGDGERGSAKECRQLVGTRKVKERILP